MKNSADKTHGLRLHTDYKIVTWFDNELPDVTVTITSGKTTYRFSGSYDGDRALTAKLLAHMTNSSAVKDSEKG